MEIKEVRLSVFGDMSYLGILFRASLSGKFLGGGRIPHAPAVVRQKIAEVDFG